MGLNCCSTSEKMKPESCSVLAFKKKKKKSKEDSPPPVRENFNKQKDYSQCVGQEYTHGGTIHTTVISGAISLQNIDTRAHRNICTSHSQHDTNVSVLSCCGVMTAFMSHVRLCEPVELDQRTFVQRVFLCLYVEHHVLLCVCARAC